MTALALHLPQRPGLSRWTVAGVTVLVAHAAIVAAIVLWYARKPVEPDIIPAIAVTLLPVEATSPEIQNQDIAVGPATQQAEEARPSYRPFKRSRSKKQSSLRPRRNRRRLVWRSPSPGRSRSRSLRFSRQLPRRGRHPRPSGSDNSPRRAPTPTTPWYSGTCSASSVIRHRRAEHQAPWWCDLN